MTEKSALDAVAADLKRWSPNFEAIWCWLRLWYLEALAASVSIWVFLRFLRPRSPAPWPGLGEAISDTPAYRAWRDGLTWPLWLLIPWAVLSVAFIGGVYLFDSRHRTDRRRERLMRYRAERSEIGKLVSLCHIRVGQGVIDASMSISRKASASRQSWTQIEKAFDPKEGHLLRQLELDRAWKAPLSASFTDQGYDNTTRTLGVRFHFIPLGDPWKLPVWVEPARGTEFFVGYSLDGDLFMDLAETPHVVIRGGTGTGKGIQQRTLVTQGLRAGYLVAVIDGGNSPEHVHGDPAATYWRVVELDLEDKAEALQAAIDFFQRLKRTASLRARLGAIFSTRGLAESSQWVHLPDDVKRWQPFILVFVSEMTALLAKGSPKLEPQRKELRELLGSDILRGARKFGISAVLDDQTATLTTTLPHGDVAQAEHVILMGDMDTQHGRAAADSSKLPKLSGGAKKLAGFYGRRGSSRLVEFRSSPTKEADLRRAAEWVGGGRFVSNQIIEATSRPAPATFDTPERALADRATEVDGHLICPPQPGQKRAMIDGRPAVNVAWFAETGEWPTPAHNLRSTCNVEHCIAPQCRHEWERSANSAKPTDEGVQT